MAFPEGAPKQEPIKKSSKLIRFDAETGKLTDPNLPKNEQANILPAIEKQVEYYTKYKHLLSENFDSYDQRDTNDKADSINLFFGKNVAESKPKLLTKPQQYKVVVDHALIKSLFNEEQVKQELEKLERAA